MDDQISDLRFYEGSVYCISPASDSLSKVRFNKYDYQISATPRTVPKVSLSTLFDVHLNKTYELQEQASSVFLSQTGNLMYLGVEGFLKAAFKSGSNDGSFEMSKLTPSHINYVALKEINKSYLAYSDKETNRFYLVDFSMN